MSDPRFCRDCRHYQQSEWESIDAYGKRSKGMTEFRCERQFDMPADIVTGHVMHSFGGNPYAMRAEDGACGPEGKLWEPRP